MCSTAVRNLSSTCNRPRSSVSSPAAFRFNADVSPCRPIENRIKSVTMYLPDSSSMRPCRDGSSKTSMPRTASPRRNVTRMLRISCTSSSTISRSRNSSGRVRLSMTTTSTPMDANIEAYSTPITPAPTTAIVLGNSFIRTMPSESMIVHPSTRMFGGSAGRVPTAIRMFRAVRVRDPYWVSTKRLCGPSNVALPRIMFTSLRCIWSVCTRVSTWMTSPTRCRRSDAVGLTRGANPRPESCERRLRNVRTASRRVLEGMVPDSRETPPTKLRFSITAAFLPSLAA